MGAGRQSLLGLAAVLLTSAGVGLVSGSLASRPASAASAAGPCASDPLLSLAAVGDTGELYRLAWPLAAPLVVGAVLAREDAAHPFDRLLFLGDNFYPNGIDRETLEDRIRRNLVRPYCRFTDMSGPQWPVVEDACPLSPSEHRPIPITAVLGNHDYQIPESPALQRHELPRYVSNWHVPEGPAHVVELPHGVSLILIDSETVVQKMAMGNAGPAPLVAALRSSRGPWRIVATHRPMATKPELKSSKVLWRAFEEAGVDVHVFLSGHEHGLQVLTMPRPAPALHLISGAGSDTRAIEDKGQLFAAESLGFVRVDLARVDGEERLFASVHTTSLFAGAFGSEAERHGCWEVDRRLRVRHSAPPEPSGAPGSVRVEPPGGEQVFEEVGTEGGSSREIGLLVDGPGLVAHRGVGRATQARRLAVGEAFQHQESDLAFGVGELPGLELLFDFFAEPRDVALGLCAPDLALGAGDAQVAGQGLPLVLDGLKATGQHGHPHGGRHDQRGLERVSEEVGQLEGLVLGQRLDPDQERKRSDAQGSPAKANASFAHGVSSRGHSGVVAASGNPTTVIRRRLAGQLWPEPERVGFRP